MANIQKKLLLIGCGKLGTILLKSWLQHNTFSQIVVVDPSLSAQQSFDDLSNLSFVKNHTLIPTNFTPDVIVIATKPHQISELLPNYKQYQSSLFVSLATSISIHHLQEKLGTTTNIIRLMPNIAIQVGQSTNLAYSPPTLPHTYRDITHKIFAHTGHLIWLDHEDLIDTLTPPAQPISSYSPKYSSTLY